MSRKKNHHRRNTDTPSPNHFLPASREEMTARGWDRVDIVLVTGDAYVDHPSFGIALIGRLLEANGYRVAVLAQPRHDDEEEFRRFGPPRLFFGISAGNLDSIVANYTGNAKVRDIDSYSPAGNPYFGKERQKKSRRRPDRASIRYASLARAAYRDVPVVLGGLEASLRRFTHWDYQQEKLRNSVLADAKADLLVYGMGERAVLEIARRLAEGASLQGIAGTCERLTDREKEERTFAGQPLTLPSWSEINNDQKKFLEAEATIDRHARALSSAPLLQRQQSGWLLQHGWPTPLSQEELDALYQLPFTRLPHPEAGEVPAHRMVRHSVTILRGCYGNCAFCAITRHQGPMVVSRSSFSVLAEIRQVAARPDFDGTVTDLGGPTANMYGTRCTKACTKRDCLLPKVCPNLEIDQGVFLELLRAAAKLPGVEHVFVSSGLRMELLLRTPELLRQILLHHTPGALKIAPEHTEDEVLRLMHKPGGGLLEDFLTTCRRIGRESGKKILFTPYFISSHPGCTVEHMRRLATEAGRLGLSLRQFQDFTPTPGTLSTAMYLAGCDLKGHPIAVARNAGERRQQRSILERELRALRRK